MKNFEEFIKARQDIKRFSVFASGNSINDLTQDQLTQIKDKSFLITLNYAPIRFKADLNFWSDKNVTNFLAEHHKTYEKYGSYCTRPGSFIDTFPTEETRRAIKDFRPLVDCWFGEDVNAIQGHFTLVFLLQLLVKYRPDVPIYLFGLDMELQETSFKWYDQFTSYDKRHRVEKEVNYANLKLAECQGQLRQYVNPQNITNMNPKCQFDHFRKADFSQF